MRNPQGYSVITDPYKVTERDTFTCCHCNVIVFVDPAPAPLPGGFCRMCMKCVCESCCDKGCTPFEKKLEAMENRERFLAQIK